MIRIEVRLIVTAETPVSVGAGGSAGTIADKTIVRDGWGRPIIPGSQVKGRTRHAAESIVAALGLPGQEGFDDDESAMNPIRAIFGSPRHRSPLRFVDLVGFAGTLDRLAAPDEVDWRRVGPIRPSVAISRRRGTAEDARLLFQETTPEGLQFSTHPHPAIGGRLPDLPHLALLWAALRLNQRWGGAKSRGLGWSRVDVMVQVGEGRDTRNMDDDELGAALRELARQSKEG